MRVGKRETILLLAARRGSLIIISRRKGPSSCWTRPTKISKKVIQHHLHHAHGTRMVSGLAERHSPRKLQGLLKAFPNIRAKGPPMLSS